MDSAVLWEGNRDSPTVLVLDPAEADQGELPGGWRGLTGQRQIVWFRLPVPDALPEAARLLADPDALGRPIDVVTGPRIPDDVRVLLADHAGALRALLLIDPAGDVEADQGLPEVTVRVVGAAGQRRALRNAEVGHDVEAALAVLDDEGSVPPLTAG
jgi:hypothetical protein